ncbi:uncharacterized protein ARB_07958 [Trichophyton benhamiae CBS 112371]|uniref:SMP-30/Gluconolactonase/LRE-like region domain-containing protein n=1 Tax=Arthroderma benhamiae (strain ATCC MYA-4681 / CBS 112371) TaxID=663331 RepID=D4AUP1_ARTBC|nr:uncharacterized protein ARB_07958 [Trichophyton benhamiae CBS 112371]EFE33206.1 conserved hypothetical protein [Trichophyton benhamiae CBS 112371]
MAATGQVNDTRRCLVTPFHGGMLANTMINLQGSMGFFSFGRLFALVSILPFLVNAATECRPSLPLPYRVLHQFPDPTYLQSLYVRSNGDILLTTAWPNGTIYYVSGPTTKSPKVTQVYQFDPKVVNVTTSIIETRPDVYAFFAGQQVHLGIGINGTFGVWELDLRPTRRRLNPGKAIVKELVHIPNGGLLSGLDVVPDDSSTLLVADSTVGVVWHVDTVARKYKLGIQDPAMPGPPWAATQFGIDGLQYHKGYLYWTNSFEARIYRIRMTRKGFAAPGAKGELFKEVRSFFLDNFTFGPRNGDTMWVATNADNRLITVSPDGNVTVVLGEPDELTVSGVVQPAFGKLPGDTHTMYAITSGAFNFPINGTVTEGGKLIAVDTRGYC